MAETRDNGYVNDKLLKKKKNPAPAVNYCCYIISGVEMLNAVEISHIIQYMISNQRLQMHPTRAQIDDIP